MVIDRKIFAKEVSRDTGYNRQEVDIILRALVRRMYQHLYDLDFCDFGPVVYGSKKTGVYGTVNSSSKSGTRVYMPRHRSYCRIKKQAKEIYRKIQNEKNPQETEFYVHNKEEMSFEDFKKKIEDLAKSRDVNYDNYGKPLYIYERTDKDALGGVEEQ